MITDDTISQAIGDLEKPSDAGQGGEGEVKLWLKALALSDHEEKDWRKSAAETIQLYRDGRASIGNGDSSQRRSRYNILYANTETMAPALFNSDPVPDCRRRFGEKDPVAKIGSEVLERIISFSVDQYDFKSVIDSAVKDLLLPGRGITRVRYKPHTEQRMSRVAVVKGEAGYIRSDGSPLMAEAAGGAVAQPMSAPEIKKDDLGEYIEGDAYEAISYEEVYCEHVQWADFRRGPGKIPQDWPWVAFCHYLTRDEVKQLNPEVGAKVQLDASAGPEPDRHDGGQEPTPDIFKRLKVWEIWDKSTKRVIFIAPNWKHGPIKTEEDPLNLNGFFPIPQPLYAVKSPESSVPVELYRLYQSQAEELDTVTRRLTALTKVMKWRGIYATTEDGTAYLDQLRTAQDGDLVPSQSAFAFAQQGGIQNYIWLMPLNELVQVIDKLSLRAEQIKNNIYEIMGIADILRGSTQASETATAQNIKAQWGSLRLSQMQGDVQRYCRDLFRIMAEIIAEKFSPETMAKMTGIDLPMSKDELLQKAMMSGQQPGPELLEQPTWEDVIGLLRNDALRSWRIDVETDSTIQADVQRTQRNISEFIGGFAQFIQAIGPAVEAGAMPQEAAVGMMKSFARAFKLPRQAMDALDNLPEGQKPQNQAAEMQQQAEAQKMQAEQAKTAAEMQRTQLDGQIAAQKGQMDLQKMQFDAQMAQQQHAFDMEFLAASHNARMAELAAKAAQPKQKPEQRVQ